MGNNINTFSDWKYRAQSILSFVWTIRHHSPCRRRIVIVIDISRDIILCANDINYGNVFLLDLLYGTLGRGQFFLIVSSHFEDAA